MRLNLRKIFLHFLRVYFVMQETFIIADMTFFGLMTNVLFLSHGASDSLRLLKVECFGCQDVMS